MSFQLTQRVIKLLCGPQAYERGEAYYRQRKVSFIQYASHLAKFEAKVKGTSTYHVSVEIDANGDVGADCDCQAFYTYNNYCKHIAAVLLNIHDIEHEGRAPIKSYAPHLELIEGGSNRSTPFSERMEQSQQNQDLKLMNGILGLFQDKRQRSSATRALFDTRTPLDVQFIVRSFPYGFRKYMFGIEMKLGPKRLYVVPKVRELLERIERSEAATFSKNFTYDPEQHSFHQANDLVIRKLIQISQLERMFQETSATYAYSSKSMSGDRMLLIPPSSWDELLPLLLAAPMVQLEHEDGKADGIHLSDESLPLRFEFNQSQAAGEGYQMAVQGIDDLMVMESYGVVIYEGRLIKTPSLQCKRLAELKQLIDNSRSSYVQIPPEQMEPFMEKVVPGLMKIGSVNIAQSVSERIIRTPLKAKLYLDRVKDRLLAGLEFQYGELILNPLETTNGRQNTHRIVVRDGEREARILELMDGSNFMKTDSGYMMEDEDSEFAFLYHVVPELEKLLQVYATTAVKVRLHVGHAPPKIRVDVDERTDWLECDFEVEGVPEAEIRELLKSLEEKRKYYKLPSGAFVPLESKEFLEIRRFMQEMGVRKGDLKGANLRLPVVRGLHLIDSDHQGAAVKLGKSLRQMLSNMRNPDGLDFPLPKGITTELRDYQKYGYQWLKTLAHYRFGGILADDMGLGKTLQSITFLVSVLPEIREQQMPAIIVCPASLLYNWHNELKKFAPGIRTVIADGSKTDRNSVLQDLSNIDVVITSYPLLRRDIDDYVQQAFHTLILDEAQAFKNHTTQTAQAVKEIQARYRFALTGTPVENALEELWSIFDVVFPELFQGKRAFNDLPREAVAKRIRPFLLRRLKRDVLKELPEKIESVQASELLPEQKKLYLSYLAMLQKETLRHLSVDGFQKHRIKILAGLTRLRQLCCHPALFVEGYEGSSAKFEQLLEILEECQSAGKRVLIFSQFTQMLGLIGRELGNQGVPFFYLDGSTPAVERMELCNRFNDGERELFLISLKAGGTGLNLTGADTVILYDLWWNPAVEQQAADRAHRIGQKNVVQVIRLVTQGTVEDKMNELQQRKKNLVDEIIQPGEESLSTLSEQEIREILMLE
ncbi:MAG: SNF2 helicase associated domain-containing protein [Candidatus Cohnella colombiensis]|uniref:SNF2 helicase associated domain-containing protein n=1 Tax=Candidatus Cohnella colombiensis TaxID=3121368 RepID=A0AA95EY18_9BACL|nr:MAG: SNF2 helicase associated domain-containing protein [Cohnella sp.]